MRQALKTLAIFAFSKALADVAVDHLDPDKTIERALYKTMSKQSMKTLNAWTDTVHPKDVKIIHDRLEKFCELAGWVPGKGKNIQTYCNFILYLLENLKETLKNQTRIQAVDDLLESIMAVYTHFAFEVEKREYPLCMNAGMKAVKIWNEVINAD